MAAETLVTKRVAVLRDAPGDAARALQSLPGQTSVTKLTARAGPWVQVQFEGTTGWLHTFDLATVQHANASSVGTAVGSAATGFLRGVTALFNRGGAGQGTTVATATVGIRGLGAEDLSTAQPDLAAVDRLDASRVEAGAAQAFGMALGWRARELDAPFKLPTLPALSSNTAGALSGFQGADLMALLTVPLSDIDLPREREIGRQLASVLLGSKPLHPDAALQSYVNQLGRWVSLQSTRPDLPWAFAVLDDRGYNAFAAPGGYVFVTKGLIDQVGDESELAAILAHEIAHVTEKHHLKALKSSASSGAMARMGAQLLGSQVKNSTVRGVLSDQGLSLVRDLYSKGLDRGDEYDADRQAVTVATRAGFDPYGLVNVLQGLSTATSDNPMFSLALHTHPPTTARLDQLEAAMGRRLDGFAGAAPVSVERRLEMLRGRVFK